jgi:thiol-disulfide isomerase/thioredoxin
MLKKIITTLLLISSLFAYKVHTNMQEAINDATQNTKPILVIVYSSTCPHCADYFKKMQQNPQIINFIRNNFVSCILNVNRQNIPDNIPYQGKVPFTDVLFYNGKTIAPPVSGEIPLNYLGQYLSQSKMLFNKYLQNGYQGE